MMKTEDEFFVFEEDCEWSVLEKFTDIRVDTMRDRSHEETFWNWYDRDNPVVQNRIKVDQERADGDPDLIISAQLQDDGRIKVWTADDKVHYVNAYNRNEYGNPYLSLCEGVQSE
jgi:hypothetical protein